MVQRDANVGGPLAKGTQELQTFSLRLLRSWACHSHYIKRLLVKTMTVLRKGGESSARGTYLHEKVISRLSDIQTELGVPVGSGKSRHSWGLH